MIFSLCLLLILVSQVTSVIVHRHEYNFTIAYADNSTSILLINNQLFAIERVCKERAQTDGNA